MLPGNDATHEYRPVLLILSDVTRSSAQPVAVWLGLASLCPLATDVLMLIGVDDKFAMFCQHCHNHYAIRIALFKIQIVIYIEQGSIIIIYYY